MKNSGQRHFINPSPSKIRHCIYLDQWGDMRPMHKPTGMWLPPARWWGQSDGGSLHAQLCWKLLRGWGWAGVLVLWVVAKSFTSSKDLKWFMGKSCFYQWDCADAGARNKFSFRKRLTRQSLEASFSSFPIMYRAWSQLWLSANASANVFLLL